jgi:hypothetical protein
MSQERRRRHEGREPIRATEYFEESSGENHHVGFGSKKPKGAPQAE